MSPSVTQGHSKRDADAGLLLCVAGFFQYRIILKTD